MATGDIATSAGISLTAGTSQASDIDEEFNLLKDVVGQMKLNHPRKISVQATAPTSPVVGDVWIKVV